MQSWKRASLSCVLGLLVEGTPRAVWSSSLLQLHRHLGAAQLCHGNPDVDAALGLGLLSAPCAEPARDATQGPQASTQNHHPLAKSLSFISPPCLGFGGLIHPILNS